MNAIVAAVVAREATRAQTKVDPLSLISLFCGVGLLGSLALVFMGFDLGATFF